MRLKKLTLTAVLTAAALVMFVLESQLPPLTAIPGTKPGLSNIFTLFTMETLGPGWAFGLFFTRVTLGCVITGQGSAFLYSFAGGLCAYALMLLLRRKLKGSTLSRACCAPWRTTPDSWPPLRPLRKPARYGAICRF